MSDGAAEAERALALSYAPALGRGALEALLALDDRLASIVRAAREPIVAQMRLTWWDEALRALDKGPPPPEPVLRALHGTVLPHGVSGATLAGMIDGWEMLLDPEPMDAEALAAYAAARGGTLFAAAAQALGMETVQARGAGEGWSLADLAAHSSNPEEVARARALALTHFAAAFRTRWPRATRALGALALLARFAMSAAPPPVAGPRRVARLMWHRWNGT